MDKSSSQLLDSIDMPNLDLRGGPVYVDIGWLANADHRTAFRMIFERVLEENREMLEPMQLIAVAANRLLDPQASALSQLPVKMGDVFADAARVADVLYDSHNTEVELELETSSDAAKLLVSFDNPGFRLSWHATAA